MKKKKNIFDIIINTIIILLGILVIYWAIELIFGGSPELSEFNFGLIIIIGGLLFKIYRETGEIKTEMKYFSINVKESFNKTRKDMGSLKDDMSLIKKKLKVE